MKVKRFLLLACLLFTGFVSVNTAKAVISGVVLSPAIKEVRLEKDQAEVSFTVDISNTTTETADMRLTTVDFGSLDESGGVAFLGRSEQETTVYGLRQWMVLEKENVALEPGQKQSVKVTIENKDSLSPGGHYGAVLVSLARPDNSEDSLTALPSASTLVLVKKVGGEVLSLDLNSTDGNGSLTSLPKSVNLRFQNGGNTHLVPRGIIEVLNPRGKRVAHGTINQASAFVLPESFRQMKVDLTYSTKLLWPGRYKVVTNWRYEGREDFQQSVVEFIYLGSIVSLIIFVVCIVLICIVVRLAIKKRKLIHRSGKQEVSP
ncbi:MAG: hypothetical protein M3Q14_04355 [bacterium]|nr:hypothetical protein [bacterium]